MAESVEPRNLTVIAKCMGKTTGYASTYKKRLLEQGLIAENADGSYRFELPFLVEYVVEAFECTR